MDYRKAEKKDSRALVELWKGLMDHHAGDTPVFVLIKYEPEKIEKLLLDKINSDKGRVFVIEDSNGILNGFIVVRYEVWSDMFKLHKKGYIAETYIKEGFRSKNSGEKLLRMAEYWLKQQGADHIELQVSILNEGAQKFWKKHGFLPSTHHYIKEI